jgi:hypothetical protein
MPCSDGCEDVERMENAKMKGRLDAATRAACEMSKHLSDLTIRRLSGETQLWIKEHRKEDALREVAHG